MKRYLFLLFFGLLPVFAFPQSPQYSALYFNNGKLRADSSLVISAEQFNVWRFAERNMVSWIAPQLSYPKLADRNGVESLIIVAFDCKNGEINNIRVVKAAHSVFNEAGLTAIQKASNNIIKELEFWEAWGGKKLKYKGTYYIPIDFSLLPLQTELQKKSAIPVVKVASGGLSYPAH